jgi:hypothetical protein
MDFNSRIFVTDLSSFMTDIPARWDIQALTDTELYTIHKADYETLQNKIPQWHILEKNSLFIAL